MAPDEEKMTKRSPLDFPIVSMTDIARLNVFILRDKFEQLDDGKEKS